MADRTITERLQPSLLDRLTDNAPETANEARDQRVIDIRRLRDIIRRDLAWLLNTNNHETLIDRVKHPHALTSTINYGIREVAGGMSTVRRATEIRDTIREAIIRFEPRIRPETVRVELRQEEDRANTIINFDIRADMWAQPVPLELYIRSEVNVVTGELKLDRAG